MVQMSICCTASAAGEPGIIICILAPGRASGGQHLVCRKSVALCWLCWWLSCHTHLLQGTVIGATLLPPDQRPLLGCPSAVAALEV